MGGLYFAVGASQDRSSQCQLFLLWWIDISSVNSLSDFTSWFNLNPLVLISLVIGLGHCNIIRPASLRFTWIARLMQNGNSRLGAKYSGHLGYRVCKVVATVPAVHAVLPGKHRLR